MRQVFLRLIHQNSLAQRRTISLFTKLPVPGAVSNASVCPQLVPKRFITRCSVCRKESDETRDENEEADEYDKREKARKTALSTITYFDSKERNKETFEAMLEIYKERNKTQRGIVEFIYAAMSHMDDYQVSYNLDTYKKIIKLLPEKKYVPENVYQEAFYQYPKQQDCIVSLLDQMESKGVCPDKEMANIVRNRFGPRSYPLRKIWRQLYWFPKFKNANPWPVPWPPISDRFLLAKLAVERMVSVDAQSVVSVWQTSEIQDAIDDTFVVSGQSPTQKQLLEEHPSSSSLFVEGAFTIWIGNASLNYFVLRADPKKFEEVEDPDDVSYHNIPFIFENKKVIPKPSVHEQTDGTILAVCVTGSSSRDSLLSWIRLLEENGNPALANIPVTFSLKAPTRDVVAQGSASQSNNEDTERISGA